MQAIQISLGLAVTGILMLGFTNLYMNLSGDDTNRLAREFGLGLYRPSDTLDVIKAFFLNPRNIPFVIGVVGLFIIFCSICVIIVALVWPIFHAFSGQLTSAF